MAVFRPNSGGQNVRMDDPHGNARRSDEGKRLNRKKDWVEGWWDHIGPEPIYCRDKYDVKRACEAVSKRLGKLVIPKAFAKPKSQGKGVEWAF